MLSHLDFVSVLLPRSRQASCRSKPNPPRLCRSRPPQPATNFLSCDRRQSSHPPVTAVRRRRSRPPLLPPPRPPRAPSNVGIGESTTAVLPALHEIMTHQQQISERQAIGSAYVSKAEREVFPSVHYTHQLMLACIQETLRDLKHMEMTKRFLFFCHQLKISSQAST